MANELFVIRAQVVKALSHPLRLRIIEVLKPGEEKNVYDLSKELGCAQPSISKHLAVLKNSGVLSFRKEDTKTYYKLRIPCVKEFLSCIDNILKDDLRIKKKELAKLNHERQGRKNYD